jgi:hypothetical protein
MMPYTKPELRPPIDEKLDPLIERLIEMAELNMPSSLRSTNAIGEKSLAGCITYIIFKLLRKFYADGRWYEKMDAEKVCASAIDEFKRRFLYPYEDEAIKRNGDVE